MPRVSPTPAVLRWQQARLPISCGQLCSSLTLCSLRRRTWFPSKYRTCMLFKETRFNCWWLDGQIGMYLCGEHSDPTEHSSAQRAENCGICHLTQQESAADGAQLGRSAAAVFFFFFFLVVVALGADTGGETFCLVGFAASASLGTSQGHQGSHVMRGNLCEHAHFTCSWLAGSWAA